MNILITGANGQLGNCLRLAALDKKNNYIFTDVAQLDITNAESVNEIVSSEDIKVIINCAAYTNVDKAECESELAKILNANAVENLAYAAKNNNATLIHISTDYVFGGNLNNTPCTENQKTNPTGVYGRTKLQGEENVIQSGCSYLIFRTSWLYSEYGKNFVKTMLALTKSKSVLKVIFDQVGTPTYAQDLADAIVNIIENNKFFNNSGIYHYSNEGVCSWFDFTKAIASIANNTNCNIQPCHSNEFPSPVVRPSYSVLDKTKFKSTFDLEIPYWINSLEKCIRNLYENEA